MAIPRVLVIYTGNLELMRYFYSLLGFKFHKEQHGLGPIHYACELGDGKVFELYPRGSRAREYYVLNFWGKDIKAVRAHLEKGMLFGSIVCLKTDKVLQLNDPDNNSVLLMPQNKNPAKF